VNEAVREVASGLDAGGDRVRTDLSPSVGAVLADPVALRRILENLVRNGLDAAGDGADGGGVEIRTAPGTAAGELAGGAPGPDGRGGRVVRITVADDGPGIPEEDRERIFRDFYTTREEGVGLGLSIVRRLVADLDGSLELETRPGVGSAFTVEFPAADGGDPGGARGGDGSAPGERRRDGAAADDDGGEAPR
jgi:signal transduction histidine kinase